MTALVEAEHAGKQRQRATPRQAFRAGSSAGLVLALGGGFSRGFAHLGVLDVLQTERIPISAIVGTSIGALLGAAYAEGISVQDLCNLGRQVRVRDFLRFHPAEPGASRKDRLGLFIQEWFSAITVQELPIPTAIVTTDLDTAAPFVFTKGPLELALRASCAFPGLVKPVAYEGRLLADGCITAPVPTAIAARVFGGPVLAVNVGASPAGLADTGANGEIQDFDCAAQYSRDGRPERSGLPRPEIALEPRVQHLDWSDFSRVDEAFAAGAQAARQALPGVRELLARHLQMTPAMDFTYSASEGLTR
jgi:NTE family protein